MTTPEETNVSGSIRWWNRVAVALWACGIIGVALRVVRAPKRATSFATYLEGGMHWRHAQPLYDFNWGDFVYGPIVAAFFSLFTFIPQGWGNLIWQAISAGIFLGGVAALFRWGPFRGVAPRRRAFVFIAIFPLAIGNMDRAQSNPFIIGLVMIAFAAAATERWALAAAAAAIAAHCKVYPLAAGMLLCVAAPRKMTWRLAAGLLLLGALPFALQDPHYVLNEYRLWAETRLADNRLYFPLVGAHLDLWFLLVRLGHAPIGEAAYRGIQVLGGGAIAAFCVVVRRRGWQNERILAGLFMLVSIWMLLLGPGTESPTYVLLAPAAAIGLVQAYAFGNRNSAWVRALATGAFLLLLTVQMKNHFAAHFKNPYFMALQPLGAVVFLFYSIEWLRNDAMWPADDETPPPKRTEQGIA